MGREILCSLSLTSTVAVCLTRAPEVQERWRYLILVFEQCEDEVAQNGGVRIKADILKKASLNEGGYPPN